MAGVAACVAAWQRPADRSRAPRKRAADSLVPRAARGPPIRLESNETADKEESMTWFTPLNNMRKIDVAPGAANKRAADLRAGGSSPLAQAEAQSPECEAPVRPSSPLRETASGTMGPASRKLCLCSRLAEIFVLRVDAVGQSPLGITSEGEKESARFPNYLSQDSWLPKRGRAIAGPARRGIPGGERRRKRAPGAAIWRVLSKLAEKREKREKKRVLDRLFAQKNIDFAPVFDPELAS